MTGVRDIDTGILPSLFLTSNFGHHPSQPSAFLITAVAMNFKLFFLVALALAGVEAGKRKKPSRMKFKDFFFDRDILPPNADRARAWVTTGNGKRRMQEDDDPKMYWWNYTTGNKRKLAFWDLELEEITGRKQTFQGFGATITEATKMTLAEELGVVDRLRIYNETFSEEGLNLQFVRMTRGSDNYFGTKDYYTKQQDLRPYDYKRWKYLFVEPPKIENFTLGAADQGVVKLLLEMKEYKQSLKVIGSPRVPNDWSVLDHPKYKDQPWSPDYYAEWAKRYIQAVQKLGLEYDAFTIQSEWLGDSVSREGKPRNYTAGNQLAELIRDYVKPKFEEANITTPIWIHDQGTSKLMNLR